MPVRSKITALTMNLTIAHIIAILFVALIVMISVLLGEYYRMLISKLARINIKYLYLPYRHPIRLPVPQVSIGSGSWGTRLTSTDTESVLGLITRPWQSNVDEYFGVGCNILGQTETTSRDETFPPPRKCRPGNVRTKV